jgi:hypothetical protein
MDLYVRVITNARKTEIVEEKDNYLKIKLKAAPVDGKANKELIKFLADRYQVAKSMVEIISGLTSKEKLVRIYK